MVTDGIDRLRGDSGTGRFGPGPGSGFGNGPGSGAGAGMGPGFGPGPGAGFGPTFHSMPQISVDATTASEISQRYNVIVYSIYALGVGRAGRSSTASWMGVNGLEKVSDETGGECFSLGTSQPVSFKPYLDRISNQLANQYFLEFAGVPRGKGSLQRINIQAEIPKSELLAPDNVWVGPPEAAKK